MHRDPDFEVLIRKHRDDFLENCKVIKELMALKPFLRDEYPAKPVDGAIEVAIEEAVEEALLWRHAVAAKRRALAAPPVEATGK